MTTVRTVSQWWCTGCDAGDATDPGADQTTRARLDRAAERHTKSTGHTTHFRQTPEAKR
jgi:hypothetical protein